MMNRGFQFLGILLVILLLAHSHEDTTTSSNRLLKKKKRTKSPLSCPQYCGTKCMATTSLCCDPQSGQSVENCLGGGCLKIGTFWSCCVYGVCKDQNNNKICCRCPQNQIDCGGVCLDPSIGEECCITSKTCTNANSVCTNIKSGVFVCFDCGSRGKLDNYNCNTCPDGTYCAGQYPQCCHINGTTSYTCASYRYNCCPDGSSCDPGTACFPGGISPLPSRAPTFLCG